MVHRPGQSPPPRGERTTALVDHVRGRIEAGLIRPGARLPSVRQLAEEWGVSRFTAVEAYDRLVAAGWAEPRRGAGFFARVPAEVPAAVEAVRPEALPTTPSPAWLIGVMQRTHEVERAPGSGLVPSGWMGADLVRRALRGAPGEAQAGIGYGDPRGWPALRAALARKLAEVDVPADPAGIVTTNGATQAIDLVAAMLLQPGDVALVDDPGYFLPFAQLAAHGAQVVGVPWAGDGPDLAALEALLTRHQPRLYLTTASLHNPTGGALAPAKAYRLLKLAEAAGCWIVEDDVYGEIAMHPPPRLAALDGLGRVIHVGSFSKTIAPGWRVGYVAAPPALVPRLIERKVLAGVASPHPTEAAVADILTDGAYRRHVQALRERVARARARALVALPKAGFTPVEPAGDGFFVWAEGRVDAQVLAGRLWDEGIVAAPGALFSPAGGPTRFTRINVAAAENATLVARLAAANRP